MAEVFSIGMLLLGLEPIMVRSQSIFHLGENSQGANGGNMSLDRIFRSSHPFSRSENQDSLAADPHALSRLG